MKEPIRILHMIPSFYHGGEQAMIMNIYEKIDRNIIQFDFICDHEEYDGLKDKAIELGAKIYFVPSFKLTNIREIKKAWEKFFCEHKEYKILHVHERGYVSIFVKIAKKHGVKVICHSHNTSNGNTIKGLIKTILQKSIRYNADYFFACSLEAGKWLFGNKIVNNKRYHILNNAIDTDKFVFNEKIREEYRKKYNIDNKKVFIQIGRLTKQKNYLFTLDVFNKYIKTNKQSKLFIIGDGELKQVILNKINEYGIKEYIEILDHRNDINCLLQMADYYIMPSLWEGLSVATIEAQASGISLLLSDKVDKNCSITNLCKFLPLDTNIWLDNMSKEPIKRENKKQDIINSGFDINETVKWLQEYYLNLYNE